MLRRGATLLELLIAIVLVGVMYSIVAVTFHPGTNVHASVELNDVLRRAQDSAVITGRPHTITVSQSGRTFAVTVTEAGLLLADTALHVGAFIPSRVR